MSDPDQSTEPTGSGAAATPDLPDLPVLRTPDASEVPALATPTVEELPALAPPDLPQLDAPEIPAPDLPALASPEIPALAAPEIPPVEVEDTAADTALLAQAAAGTKAAARPRPPGRGAGPRRGRGPGAGPGPQGMPKAPAAPVVAEVPASDPSLWGRVDAEGSVWLRTTTGERSVGSFPGATPEEALAYFGRKYDELVGQVMLLEQRVAGTELPPQEALGTIRKLNAGLREAAVVGDLEALRARLADLLPVIETRHAEAESARTRRRQEARAAKERVVVEAESLAESSEWKHAGDELRRLLEEWKRAPRLERAADDELWKRFSTARSTFDKRRRQHFSALDGQREESQGRKERLIAEAESLADSTDWGATGARLRELMTQWKSAGRARRDVEDELWGRFRAAQDRFFAARSVVFDERDTELRENETRKTALAEEAERILPVRDLGSAKAALRAVQERWEQVGHVPRDHRDRVEGRLRRVEDAVREVEESAWKRTNPEAAARAAATVAQLQQSIAKLARQAEQARARGDVRKAAEAEESAAVRQTWLVEAEKTLHEFS